MRADSTMTRDVIVVPPELSLRDAQRIMDARQIRHLPVVSGGRVVGILSDRDVLLRTTLDGERRALAESFVKDAMSPSPISCQMNTTVSWLAETMVSVKIDAIPVVDKHDRILGIVTSSDLLALLIDPGEEDKILPFDFNLLPVNQAGIFAVA